MARIPYPSPETLDDEARRSLEGLPALNVLRMLSHSGPVLAGYAVFGNRILYSLQIDPVLREMAIVRVGHRCRCAYELVQHERFIAELGVSPERIAALRVDADQTPLSEIERCVVAFTDDVITNIRASDSVLSDLRRHFTDRKVVELIMTIGCYQMLCMMLETCGVDIESAGAVPQLSQAEWQRRMRSSE